MLQISSVATGSPKHPIRLCPEYLFRFTSIDFAIATASCICVIYQCGFILTLQLQLFLSVSFAFHIIFYDCISLTSARCCNEINYPYNLYKLFKFQSTKQFLSLVSTSLSLSLFSFLSFVIQGFWIRSCITRSTIHPLALCIYISISA